MHNLDLGMALRARRSDVATSDRRCRICVRKNGVRRVARHAVGCNDKPFLEQRLTMDTLREILQDVILMDRSLGCDRRSLCVTLTAEERNLQD